MELYERVYRIDEFYYDNLICSICGKRIIQPFDIFEQTVLVCNTCKTRYYFSPVAFEVSINDNDSYDS